MYYKFYVGDEVVTRKLRIANLVPGGLKIIHKGTEGVISWMNNKASIVRVKFLDGSKAWVTLRNLEPKNKEAFSKRVPFEYWD
jgi:uncharacterized membrane protein (UPF0127 family)